MTLLKAIDIQSIVLIVVASCLWFP